MCGMKKHMSGGDECSNHYRAKREDLSVVQCLTHLKVSQCLHGVFMGAAFTERVTDGISNCHSDKYYFPLLKGGTLLFSTFVLKPVL